MEASAATVFCWNSTTEGIFGLDERGCVTFANNAARRILKLPDNSLGTHMHGLTHYKRPDGTPYPWEECPIFRAISTRKQQSATDEVFWTTTGEPVDVEFTSSPVNDQESPTGTVVVFRDVRERKMLQ